MTKITPPISIQIQQNIAKKAFTEREFISTNSFSFEIITILEVIQSILSSSYVRQKFQFSSKKIEFEGTEIFSIRFDSTTSDQKLIMKGLVQEKTNTISLNILEKGQTDENLFCIDLEIGKTLDLEKYVETSFEKISNEFAQKLKMESNCEPKSENSQKINSNSRIFIQGNQNPDNYFVPRSNFVNDSRNRFEGIRFDPIMPPGILPNHNNRFPDSDLFPNFGRNNGELMGPNHSFFRNRGIDPNNSRSDMIENFSEQNIEPEYRSHTDLSRLDFIGIDRLAQSRTNQSSLGPLSLNQNTDQPQIPSFGRPINQDNRNFSNNPQILRRNFFNGRNN